MIDRIRTARTFLVHNGCDTRGPFARIVAGSDNSKEDAAIAMKAYGCNPDRPEHRLVDASEIDHDPMTANFASFYSRYTLDDQRLAELRS